MTFRRKKQNKPVWACRNHDQDKLLCSQRSISETEIYAAFVRLYNKLKLNRDRILIPLLRQLRDMKNCNQKNNLQIQEINMEMANLSGKLLVLNRIKSKGLLDDSLYIVQCNEINHKLAELKSKKGCLIESDEDDTVVSKTQMLLDVLECGPEYLEEFNEELFEDMVEQIVASPK